MKTPKLGDYAASTNDELLAAAKADGDALHCEMAHRIRILTVNLTQSESRESELVQTRQYLERECQNLGRQVAEQTVGSVDRRPNLNAHKRCVKCGARHSALVLCPVLPECPECGGRHERSGARTDCIRHWKYRALEAENKLLVKKVYGV